MASGGHSGEADAGRHWETKLAGFAGGNDTGKGKERRRETQWEPQSCIPGEVETAPFTLLLYERLRAGR